MAAIFYLIENVLETCRVTFCRSFSAFSKISQLILCISWLTIACESHYSTTHFKTSSIFDAVPNEQSVINYITKTSWRVHHPKWRRYNAIQSLVCKCTTVYSVGRSTKQVEVQGTRQFVAPLPFKWATVQLVYSTSIAGSRLLDVSVTRHFQSLFTTRCFR